MTLDNHYKKLLNYYNKKLGEYVKNNNFKKALVITKKITYYINLIKDVPIDQIRISQIRGLTVALYNKYGEEISTTDLYVGCSIFQRKMELQYVNSVKLKELFIDYMISNNFMDCVIGNDYEFIISKKLIRKFKLRVAVSRYLLSWVEIYAKNNDSQSLALA